jgi:hypothetical protein
MLKRLFSFQPSRKTNNKPALSRSNALPSSRRTNNTYSLPEFKKMVRQIHLKVKGSFVPGNDNKLIRSLIINYKGNTRSPNNKMIDIYTVAKLIRNRKNPKNYYNKWNKIEKINKNASNNQKTAYNKILEKKGLSYY